MQIKIKERPILLNGTIIGDYKILRFVGEGSNSLAYQAINQKSETFFVIKEVFPIRYFKSGLVRRSKDNTCIEFTELCDNYIMQSDIRKSCSRIAEHELHNIAKLRHTSIEENANNNPNIFNAFLLQAAEVKTSIAKYIVIETEAGDCLPNINFTHITNVAERIVDKLNVVIRICETVELIHTAELLHCDLKPDNIYISKQSIGDNNKIGNRFAVIIDFGSSLHMKDGSVFCDDIKAISSSPKYQAPELSNLRTDVEINFNNNLKSLGPFTDIYSILIILLYLICNWKKVPDVYNYAFELKNSEIAELPKTIQNSIIKLFSNGLNKVSTRKNCFPDVSVLKQQLSYLILDIENKPYIRKNHFISASNTYFGRDEEQRKLEVMLEESNFCFLCGMGGIGKSELALQFYEKHKYKFSNIIRLNYINNLAASMINHVVIENIDKDNLKLDDEKEKFDFYLLQLENLANPKTLIIIDDFDNEKDTYLDAFLALPFKYIFTTRINLTINSKYQANALFLDIEKNKDMLAKIFYANAPEIVYVDNNVHCLYDLIETVGGHTLSIILLAKQLRETRTNSIPLLLTKMKNIGISQSFKTRIAHSKDSIENTNTAYEHIKAIFDFSTMSNIEISELKVLSYIPPSGIADSVLLTRCGLNLHDEENVLAINSLVRKGWIIQWFSPEDHANIIALHPIVSDVIWNELKPSLKDDLLNIYCSNFLDSADCCDDLFYNYKGFVTEILYFISRIWENNIEAINIYERAADVLNKMHHGKEAYTLLKTAQEYSNLLKIEDAMSDESPNREDKEAFHSESLNKDKYSHNAKKRPIWKNIISVACLFIITIILVKSLLNNANDDLFATSPNIINSTNPGVFSSSDINSYMQTEVGQLTESETTSNRRQITIDLVFKHRPNLEKSHNVITIEYGSFTGNSTNESIIILEEKTPLVGYKPIAILVIDENTGGLLYEHEIIETDASTIDVHILRSDKTNYAKLLYIYELKYASGEKMVDRISCTNLMNGSMEDIDIPINTSEDVRYYYYYYDGILVIEEFYIDGFTGIIPNKTNIKFMYYILDDYTLDFVNVSVFFEEYIQSLDSEFSRKEFEIATKLNLDLLGLDYLFMLNLGSSLETYNSDLKHLKLFENYSRILKLDSIEYGQFTGLYPNEMLATFSILSSSTAEGMDSKVIAIINDDTGQLLFQHKFIADNISINYIDSTEGNHKYILAILGHFSYYYPQEHIEFGSIEGGEWRNLPVPLEDIEQDSVYKYDFNAQTQVLTITEELVLARDGYFDFADIIEGESFSYSIESLLIF